MNFKKRNYYKNCEKNRNEFAISTKIGRLIVPSKTGDSKFKGSPIDRESQFDFSYDGAMRSFEMSLKRTGLDKFDVLHLHDPDNSPEHYKQALDGALKIILLEYMILLRVILFFKNILLIHYYLKNYLVMEKITV